MTLDEAIKHAEEVADVCEFEASKYDMTDAYESHVACREGKCAEEHRQLAEWLKELKQLRNQTSWIPVSERLPEGKVNPMTNDFELALCSTVWEDVRPYKFGKPIGNDKAHFWNGGGIVDDYVIAWMPMPEHYKEAKND